MNLKKVLTLILALALCLSLCACGSDGDDETTAGAEETTTAPEETTAAPVDDGKVTYTVTVKDTDGKPISGAMVQLCKDTCLPGATDAEGVATFRVAEDDYKVSFMMLPAGYALVDETVTEFYFDSGSYELTLTLKPAA